MALKRKSTYLEILTKVILDNSEDIAVGDAVMLRNGNIEKATADGALSGVVIDVVDKNNNSLLPSEGSTASLGSASISSGVITVASDNETVDQIAATIDISPFTIYSADVTGTIGTTNSSDKIGVWIDMDDEDSVEETTATRTVTTEGQLVGWGADPDDTTRMLVSIHEHEFFNYGGTMA